MKRNIFWLILLIMILSGCSQQSDDPKYQPQINPNPKYFMTVKGNVDPQLIGKINIGIEATYTTRNKECDVQNEGFAAGRDWRFKEITFKPVEIAKNGDYQFKIPLDNFQPGFCNWRIFRLEGYSGTQAIGTLVDFGPCDGDSMGCNYTEIFTMGKYVKTAQWNIYCHLDQNQRIKCDGGNITNFTDDAAIPRNQNYQFNQNYSLKRS